jgi:carboxymethylenebutenolidase
MDRKIADLYDEYLHTPMGRRVFMRRLTLLTGSVAAATAVLSSLEGTQAVAAQIDENDARLTTSNITYPGGAGDVKAYLARPVGTERLPAVIVIHANRGLWPHFKDVARKLALSNFLVLAPDMLSRSGGTPQSEDSRSPEGDAALAALAKIQSRDIEEDLVDAVDFLKSHPGSTGKVGSIGFCWGGGHSLSLAVNSPDLNAAVAFYGAPPQSGYENIRAPILGNYAADDPRLVNSLPGFISNMEEHQKPYELYIYPGTKHAFNQDNRPDRYNKEASELAWDRTLGFFRKHLG